MKLLILGGTVFLGRHLVDAALSQGHEVTLFTRGKHNAHLYPTVEKIKGDRATDLGLLSGRRWDAVIDTSGYLPADVRAAAEGLRDAVDLYAYVSSLSVYKRWIPGQDEQSEVHEALEEASAALSPETYGPLKLLCERAAERALPGRALQLRAGLIVGPHDPTRRFTYWPSRVARGGEVLAPGRPERQIQFIDVRDLAGWIVRAVEGRLTGAYNLTGPDYPLTMERLLTECNAVTGGRSRFTWVDDQTLLAGGAGPWLEIPLWIPAEAGGMTTDCHKALAQGLTFRPLAETILDTLAWSEAAPESAQPTIDYGLGLAASGLSPEREAALLSGAAARRDRPASAP